MVMTSNTATPFYTTKNGNVTLWSDGKLRRMQVTVHSQTMNVDINSIPKDVVRHLADEVDALVVWVLEKSRDAESKKHMQTLLRMLQENDD